MRIAYTTVLSMPMLAVNGATGEICAVIVLVWSSVLTSVMLPPVTVEPFHTPSGESVPGVPGVQSDTSCITSQPALSSVSGLLVLPESTTLIVHVGQVDMSA